MNIATLVSIAVNVLFALVIGLGFLIGYRRGWKKATLRFGIILVGIVVLAFVCPLITNKIMEIKIGEKSIKTMLSSYVTNASSFFADNPSTTKFIEALISTIANLLVFIVANILVALLSFFIYLIVSSICFREERLRKKELKKQLKELKKAKDKQGVKEVKKEKKDHTKWIGGAVGLCHGFVMLFVIFLPFNGLIGAYADMTTSTKSSSSQNSSGTVTVSTTQSLSIMNDGIVYTLSSDSENLPSKTDSKATLPASVDDLVKKYVPSQVSEIIGAYQHSALKATCGVFNLDGACFDSLTKIDVGGEKIEFRKDIINVAKLYNQIAPFYNEYIASGKDISEYDYDTLCSIIDTAFEFSSLRALSQELVPYAVDKFIIKGSVDFGEYDDDIKAMLSDIIDSYKNDENNVAIGIRDDLKMFAKSAKTLSDSNILKDVKNSNWDGILDTLSKENDETVDNLLNLLFSSKRIQTILFNGYNIAFDAINDYFKLVGEDRIEKFASVKDFDFSGDKEVLKVVIKNGAKFYKSVKGKNVKDIDVSSLENLKTNIVGKIFDLQFVKRSINKVADASIKKFVPSYSLKYSGDNKIELDTFLDEFIKEYKSSASTAVKSDSEILLDCAIYLKESGIEKFDAENLKKLCVKVEKYGNKTYLEKIIDRISTDRFNSFIKFSINTIIDEANAFFDSECYTVSTEDKDKIVISKIDSFNLASDATKINSIMENVLNILTKENENGTNDNLDKLLNDEKFDDVVTDFIEIKMFDVVPKAFARIIEWKVEKVDFVKNNESISTGIKEMKNSLITSDVANVKIQKDDIINLVKNVKNADILDGFDFEESDLTKVAKILEDLQSACYNHTVTGSGEEKVETFNEKIYGESDKSILLGVYKGIVDYLCEINKYGETIEGIVKDGEQIVYVNWTSVFNLAKEAQSLSKGVTSENIGGIITAIKDNPEIKDEIIDLVGTSITGADDKIEKLVNAIGEASADTVGEISSVLGDVVSVANGEGEVNSTELSGKINGLMENENSDTVITNIIDVANTAEAGFEVTEENKQNIQDVIDGIYDTELQNKLKELFGLDK